MSLSPQRRLFLPSAKGLFLPEKKTKMLFRFSQVEKSRKSVFPPEELPGGGGRGIILSLPLTYIYPSSLGECTYNGSPAWHFWAGQRKEEKQKRHNVAK